MENSGFTNDQWTIIDDLGFARAGDQLAKLVLIAEPPFAIGVNGKWGSGKTSFMRYVMARLGGLPVESSLPGHDPVREISGKMDAEWEKIGKPDNVETFIRSVHEATNEKIPRQKIKCVWFNTWQYQNDENPMIPLLHEIRNQMSLWMKAEKNIAKSLKVSMESGIEIIGRLADSALKIMKLPGGFTGITGTVRQIGLRVEQETLETLTDAQRFNLHFEKAVELLLNIKKTEKESSARLVIFIDDLDRCEENKVLLLLEMIKLHLSTKYCVFVLGIDRDAVERAVSRVWKDRSPHEAGEYIEKLFQTMVHVPVCRDYTRFIKNRLHPEFPEISEKPNEKDPEPDLISNLINQLIEPNPRKMKNFINSLMLAWKIAPEAAKAHPAKFLLIHYLRTFFHEVYRLIAYDPENLATLHEVLNEGLTHRTNQIAAFIYKRFTHVLKGPMDWNEDENTFARPEDARMAETATETFRDRYRGDQMFLSLFKKYFDTVPDREIREALCCAAEPEQPQPDAKLPAE